MTCKLRTIMSVLLVAVALLLTGTVHYFAGNVSDHSSGAVSDHLLGDADCDGSVTVKDVTAVQRHIAEIADSSDFCEPAADADGNGEISISDVTVIQMWLAEFDTDYNIGEPMEQPVETTAEPTTEPHTQMPTDDEGWGYIIFQP